MNKKAAEILIKYRNLFFISAVLLVVGSFIAFPVPKFNGSLDGFNLEDNPHYQTFEKLDAAFGNSSKIYVQITPKKDQRQETFAKVDSLVDKLTVQYPGLHVISPVTFYRKMIRHWDKSTNSLKAFYKEASEVPLLKDLIARDHGSFLLVVTVPKVDAFDSDSFDQFLEKSLDNSMTAVSFSKFHLEASIKHHIGRDIVKITICILIFFFAFIFITFRGALAAIYSSLVVLISVAASLCLFSIFSIDINVISILVIPIVLILSLSDCMHILAGYSKFQHLEDKKERIKAVISHYFIPSFYSSATTAAAFFSFYLFNETVFIKQFGLITAIALMMEFVLTFSVTGFLLHFFNLSKIADKQITGYSNFLYKHSKAFSYVLIFILMISIYFIPKVKFESNSKMFFPQGSEILAVQNEFKKNFLISNCMHVMIQPKKGSKLKEGELSNFVDELSNDMQNEEGVVNVFSATGKYMFKTKLGVPVNLYSHFKEDNPFYNSEKDIYHVEIQMEDDEGMYTLQSKLDKRFLKQPENIDVAYTCRTLLMDETNKSISMSLIKSLLTSGVGIMLVILFLTKSIKISLLSMIPNLIPVAFIVLIFYFFDLHFNILTALTIVVGIGLLDDDTVHILYRKLWLKEPLEELNFSIISSAIILGGAFLIFLISSFEPIQVFGWITALIIIVGVICELTIMRWVLDQIKEK